MYPVQPAPRTAVLIAGFRSKGPIRVFAEGWTEKTARFDPQSVAGTLDQLYALRRTARPTHALIVVRREWERAVIDADRDRLWRAFGVPVFEQIVDANSSLLAAECEAHDGLHIEGRSWMAGDHEIDRTPCPCGKQSPRLVDRAKVQIASASL